MAYKTMAALITDVERALYQSAGPAVQLYSQDIILQQIQDAFDHLFTKAWWPQFRKRETLVLDGTTGYPTTPLLFINQYEDIRYVYGENRDRPLSKLQLATNTLNANFDTGSDPRYIEGDVTNIFRVWPSTAVGNILVVGRVRPAPYIITDTVAFDATAIKHFAAWSYFTDDASNPAAAAKHQGLFETRLAQITDDNFNEPIQLDPLTDRVPNQWFERP